MRGGMSRRQFLRGVAAALGALLMGRCRPERPTLTPAVSTTAPTSPPSRTTAPLSPTDTAAPSVTPAPAETSATPTAAPAEPARIPGRVVHIRAPGATYWDFGSDYYGNFVDQNAVDQMVERGVMELTDTTSVADAWRTLVPNYTPGRAIAIKVNFNNCLWCDLPITNCEDWQLKTDGLIHPINAIVRGLRQAYPNFANGDIWIYDATVGSNPPTSHRQIPGRFKADCSYPDVRFFDLDCNETATYNSSDPSATVVWRNPQGIPTPPTVQVTDVLVQAT
ncbi:MAG TPA: twin-arginine translocation signal domain-containing protein, partial [Chloroflexi bacterium]|nr:twin-arginine translocation signal domain-containing protein [Chloroflexota bacterium]